jgi:hypothetical protein
MMERRDQRRFKRFELHLPFELVRAGSQQLSERGETRNLSSGGVLFVTEREVEVGDVIEYIITLPSRSRDEEGVKLHCVGKVIRLDRPRGPHAGKQLRAIAATLERYEFVRSEEA